MQNIVKETLLITAVAGLFGCAGQTPAPATASGHTTASVKCQGINECKGQAGCAGNGHPCGKHTPCKGQGWLSVATASECQSKGGTVL